MGEVFAGRYELVDPIGRGGVGAVWRAWDHRRRRYVAAKVLQQSDAHTLLRFVREQALRIDHPHVLAPASWAADDDQVLFTMDLVNGGSLGHLIGDYGPLPPRFVCVLLDQLLAGLAAVHAEEVVHRDIKPANILLEATGTGRPHLRLSDFGISMRKGEPRLTETNYVVGTPGYFAPEQLLGAEPDFTADLYAVGLVALYLLTGRKPDSQALVEQYRQGGVPPAPQGVPEPMWQVISTLLQPDPQYRFKSATGARKTLASTVELLPDETNQEPVEVFDQLGPLPEGFGPSGPLRAGGAPGVPGGAAAGAAGAAAVGGAVAGAHGAPFNGPDTPSEGSAPGTPPSGPPAGHTDSFHLAPPTPPASPQGSYGAPGTAATRPMPPAEPPSTPSTPTPVSATQAYTAPPQPVPGAPGGAGAPAGGPAAGGGPVGPSGATAPARRPGPPAKVAIPVLVLALASLGVGFWALFQG